MSEALPLEGRLIVVTRPRVQSRPLAEALERLGATVAIVPLVEIRPPEDRGALDAALVDLEGYDWVVFTSANGVAAVAERLRSGRIPRIAAVGPATANAVRALGIEPSFVPQRFAAEEIVAGLEELGALEGARLVLPQATIADPRLAEELRAHGAAVTAVGAYRTVPVGPDGSGLDSLRRADAVVVASGSAVRSLASLQAWPEGARPLLVCIGPKTAAVARKGGFPVGLVAGEATGEGIIQALVSHFGQSTA